MVSGGSVTNGSPLVQLPALIPHPASLPSSHPTTPPHHPFIHATNLSVIQSVIQRRGMSEAGRRVEWVGAGSEAVKNNNV